MKFLCNCIQNSRFPPSLTRHKWKNSKKNSQRFLCDHKGFASGHTGLPIFGHSCVVDCKSCVITLESFRTSDVDSGTNRTFYFYSTTLIRSSFEYILSMFHVFPLKLYMVKIFFKQSPAWLMHLLERHDTTSDTTVGGNLTINHSLLLQY